MFNLVPHPPIYLAEIRPTDVWILLAVGALWEAVSRLALLMVKRKPYALLRKQGQLVAYQKETNLKRNMGPSHFVETSKLERKVLALEKELQEIYAQRQQQAQRMEQTYVKYGNYAVILLVWIIYYNVPLVTIEGLEGSSNNNEILGEDFTSADSYLKVILFPISVVGFGIRLSKWALPKEVAHCSIGALIVMWSSQVVMGRLMDAVEALVL